MKIRKKFLIKRYYIYARRREEDRWSEWTQSEDLWRAIQHVKNVIGCGFYARLVDKETKEEIMFDGEKKVS